MDNKHLIYMPEAVREMDRAAIQQQGIPGYTLMQRAGERTFREARDNFPDAGHWLVLCGAGNNGGDGYVIARLARAVGIKVTCVSFVDVEDLRGSASSAWKDFTKAGGTAETFNRAMPGRADLIVDAMLGTGLARPVEGEYLEVIEAVNAAGTPVVAVDIPSGLDSTTGQIQGAAVRAAVTVTFVGLKLGQFVGAGPDHVGKLIFDGLGIADSVATRPDPVMRQVTRDDVEALLPPRRAMSHKGMFGHVLIVGGNHGMGGAVRLAGEAALRAGAGLVTVATRPENTAAVTAGCPEIMCAGVSGPEDLEPLLERATVIALGPGLGLDDWARALFSPLLSKEQPKILDADALRLLADNPQQRIDWILTPHPGEAARLAQCDSAAVQADRIGTLDVLTERYGGVVTLKGRGTLIGMGGTRPYLVTRGNPGMATAGMGDVLTGVTAAMVAQAPGYIHKCAAVAAYVHALAGDRAAAKGGQRGLIASDVLSELRACLNHPE